MTARRQLGCVAALALLAQTGCQSCEQPRPAVVKPAAAPEPAATVAAPEPATAVVEAASVTPAYAGPASKAADGFQLSTGFLDAHNKPVPQPQSGVKTDIYTTALDPAGHPIGQLQALDGAEMTGFLVARDLRHALYARAEAPVREGADARALAFVPPAGGDHALVALFAPQGDGVHAVTSPVSVAGNLPQLMGPGLAGQTANDHLDDGAAVQLKTQVANGALQLTFAVPSAGTGRRGALEPPFVVLLDPPMGQALVLERQENAEVVTWPKPRPGDWLVLVPQQRRARALMFKLTVQAAGERK